MRYKISYPAPSFREFYFVEAENVRNHLSNVAWSELHSTGTVLTANGTTRIEVVEA